MPSRPLSGMAGDWHLALRAGHGDIRHSPETIAITVMCTAIRRREGANGLNRIHEWGPKGPAKCLLSQCAVRRAQGDVISIDGGTDLGIVDERHKALHVLNGPYIPSRGEWGGADDVRCNRPSLLWLGGRPLFWPIFINRFGYVKPDICII